MTTVLIVDDEAAMRRTMRVLLEGEGYTVKVARNGDEALAKIAEEKPDLVLLDVMMPGQNGFRVCEAIRKSDKLLPILFLTALEGEAEQVRGFGLGADDYIVKTAGDAEVLARVRRALARAAAYRAARLGVTQLTLGKVTVDFTHRRITDGKGLDERLTGTEADLLRLLASGHGHIFSINEILETLRGEGCCVEETTIRSQICRLKAKLGVAGDLLTNERALGYSLLA